MKLSDDEWKKRLSPERYEILREKGTELPFTGDLLYNKDHGTYTCAACGSALFSSETKFDSGSGWPSFYDVLSTDAVKLAEDTGHGMRRVEIQCANCGGHLGHVFNDAPEQPTGMRFCVNSMSLDFEPADKKV
jgi:peptide-methionine (R)-S-oxide reductase